MLATSQTAENRQPAATSQTTQTAVPCCVVKPPETKAPPHKYLIEIVAVPGLVQKGKPQSILLLASCTRNGEKILCADASVGTKIDILARADSGLPVRLTVTDSQTSAQYGQQASISATRPGKLLIRASQSGSRAPIHFAPAADVELELDTQAQAQTSPAVCASFIEPKARLLSDRIDAAAVALLLGNPDPLSVMPQGDGHLAIYSSKTSLSPRSPEVRELKRSIASIAAYSARDLGRLAAPSARSIEVDIPHAFAFDDLAKKFNDLNYAGFKLENLGRNRVRVTFPPSPDCQHTVVPFFLSMRRILWQLHPEPFTAKVFFLKDGKEVATALNGSGPGVSKVSAAAIDSDLLVFNDVNPGDDDAVREKRRLLASLDLPRPEMIISTWILQNSSTDRRYAGNFNDIVQRTVSENNTYLQQGLAAAWVGIKRSIESGSKSCGKDCPYFAPYFSRYLTGRFASDLPPLAGDAPRNLLEFRSALRFPQAAREQLGYCPNDEYCLGYTQLFQPLQPRITDLLVAIIAAAEPQRISNCAIDAMQNPSANAQGQSCAEDGSAKPPATPPAENDASSSSLRKAFQKQLDLNTIRSNACEAADLDQLLKHTTVDRGSPIYLQCYRDASNQIFASTVAQPSARGLLRAALADFLFHYKASQQYPHEFSAYELTRSADTLNSALRPLIEAFHSDIRTYQRYLGARLQVQADRFNREHNSWVPWLKDKSSFSNDGLVTVRAISGQPSVVSATSQSYLDTSSAPQIADLAKSILEAAPGKSSPTGVAANVSANQAQLIEGALAAYRESSVQVGRDLTVNVTPRSLTGAGSAELTATLHSGDSAAPTYYGGPKNTKAPDLSRVSLHDTSTHIRIDSVRLFDLSSFAGVLQKSRARFPLLPPFVEIPYIGTVLGVPLPQATEFHSSTALISALIVPTAADLAAGLSFRSDQVLDALDGTTQSCQFPGTAPNGPTAICRLRQAISFADLDRQPILEYHRAMLHCLATEGASAGHALNGENGPGACSQLKFNSVLQTVE